MSSWGPCLELRAMRYRKRYRAHRLLVCVSSFARVLGRPLSGKLRNWTPPCSCTASYRRCLPSI